MRRWVVARLAVQPRTRGSAWPTAAASRFSTNISIDINSNNMGKSITSETTLSTSQSTVQRKVFGNTLSFACALHLSRVLQMPFIPSTVRASEVAEAVQEASQNNSSVNNASGSVSSIIVHELTLLPIDELVQRVHRFSRTNFSTAQRPLLYVHLKEVMKPHRVSQMPIKALQDYLHLAHVAQLHETCLEVYHAAREHMPVDTLSLHPKTMPASSNELISSSVAPNVREGHTPATTIITGSNGGSGNLVVDSAVLVSSFVVDSAYAVQSSAELSRMASYCVSQLLSISPSISTQQNDGAVPSSLSPTHHAVFAVRSPQKTVMEVSLVRCLWRALCLAEYYRCTEAGGVNGVKGNAEQALADAMAILKGCQRVGAARRVSLAQLQGDAVVSPEPQDERRYLRNILKKGLHFVRYATAGDDGEFAFFHFCKEKGILASPQPFPQSLWGGNRYTEGSSSNGDVATAAVSPSSSSSPPSTVSVIYDVDEVQVFYGSLIETCSAGLLVPEAMLYFTEARRLLGCDPLADQDDNNAEVLMASAEAKEVDEGVLKSSSTTRPQPPSPSPSPLMPSTTGCDGAPAPPPPPAPPAPSSASSADSRTVITTAATATTLTTHTNNLFTDFLIHRLLFTLQRAKDNRRTVRLARALIAAGAAATIKVNLWTLILISAGAMRAVDVVLAAHNFAMQQLTTTGVSSAEVSGSSERRTWEYLLQTTLNALSKCQLPRYEQDYLLPAQEGGVLHCTDEFYYGCLLQDAHSSMNPMQRAAEVLTKMGEAKVSLTAPLISRLLKLYLRMEAAEFFPMYKHAAEELHLRRVLWTDQLVLWADRRRYFLTAEDRAYIVEEVLRSRNVEDVPQVLPMLGGLRAQFALLHYDATHAAREQFLRDGTLPDDAPTMQDSRAHFLTTRALNVQRGVMAPVEDSWVCKGGCGVLDTREMADDGDDAEERERLETVHYGVQPRILGDGPRRKLHAAIAELSETPLLLPPANRGNIGTAGTVPNDAERLHDEALRVYLADVLNGLQRSLNSVS